MLSEENEELDILAKQIVGRLTEMKFTLALAESCTGGFAAHAVTNVRGASKVLIYSAVVYTAASKHEILNVPWDIINEFGTVSIETTKHLLKGLKEKLNPDIMISYTGVTDQILEGKPSGFVIIGLQTPAGQKIVEKTFSGNRQLVKKQAVIESFKILKEELERL